MTHDEMLRAIQAARDAIVAYKREGLSRHMVTDPAKIREIRNASRRLVVEARSLGAAGRTCRSCGGSGRM